MNNEKPDQHTPESLDEQIERLEIEKLRLETQLLEASMRRDRFRLVPDVVKWSAISAAIVFAYIAADHLGWL